ncbi:MAG: helix-turn-helix domain-containing protein, partial [Deltaproteobacteria bacterium]|nr:helix-turn-helix domain-containing protein [Deltaproteobacteria bacterium]
DCIGGHGASQGYPLILGKEYIADALKNTQGNIAKAARLLDTSERILGLRVKKYGTQSKQFR